MIKVADAIMGTGKSSAAITYMNEHPDRKFIYITPYLDETRRIADACPDLDFQCPRQTAEFHGSKILHTAELVRDGRNISTTHTAFKLYTPEMLDDIRERGYTLIVDEVLEILQSEEININDLQILKKAQLIAANEDGSLRVDGEIPPGGLFSKILRTLEKRRFYGIPGVDNTPLFYWILPRELLLAFRDVFVLTYLFHGQDLRYYLDMERIPYTYIGVEKVDGEYRFCDRASEVPEYARHLREHIHILDYPKMNALGDKKTALSKTWFDSDCNADEVNQLRCNLRNYFRNVMKCSPDELMWGCYKSAEQKLRGKGYSKGFVSFNERATNKYRDKTVLAYCANVFMHTGQKIFYTRRGVEVNEDLFALSVMVQWIWRSAIRDGRDINLYLPSKRMRDLLTDWMDRLAA